jgi:signal transduction histidine kinase
MLRKKINYLLIKHFKIKGIELNFKKKNLPVFIGHTIDKYKNIYNNIFIFNQKIIYNKIYIKPEKKKVQQLILNLRSIFYCSSDTSINMLIKQSNFLLYK